jgi:hypothetical protein
VSYRCPNLTAGWEIPPVNDCSLPLWFFYSRIVGAGRLYAHHQSTAREYNTVSGALNGGQQATFFRALIVLRNGRSAGLCTATRAKSLNRRGNAKGYFAHPYVGQGSQKFQSSGPWSWSHGSCVAWKFVRWCWLPSHPSTFLSFIK